MSEQEERIKISFNTNADETKQKVEGVANSVNKTTDAVEQQEKAQISLRQQLRNANMELQNTINKYGETSKEAIASAKAVANLKDQMEFAQQLSKSFNPDQKFKALTSASQLAGTGLQGVTSGMALFGDQSKDTQQQLLKVQAAMSFSDSISNLSNVADQWNVLKTNIGASSTFLKLNTAVTGTALIIQKAYQKATGQSAVSQQALNGAVATSTFGFKALKIAIASTGIGLLVVGIAAVVANFDKLKSVMSSIGWMKSVADTIGNIVQSVTDFVGVTSEASRLQDKMLAKANKSIKDNEYLLDVNANKYDEYTKRKIQANIDYNKKVEELNKDEELSEKEKFKRQRFYREKANQEILQADIDRAKANKKNEPKEDKKPAPSKDKKEVIDYDKIKLEKQKELNKQLEDLEDDTEQKRLDRQKERDLAEIEALGLKGKAKQDLIDIQNKINKKKQDDLDTKTKEETQAKAKAFFEQFKLEKDDKSKYEDAKTQEELDKILVTAQAKNEKELEAKKLEAEAKGEDANLTPEEKEEKKAEIQAFYNQKKEDEEKRHSDAVIAIDRAKAEQKKEIQDATFAVADAGIGILKSFDSKNKAIQKGIILAESGVALGKVGVNIATGVSKDSSAGAVASVPQIIKTVATGVLSTAQIIAGTSKALKALGTGGSIGGSGTPQAPQGVSAQPQVGVQASSENQIATSIAKNQLAQPPIKTYVVSSDVSTAQVLDAKIVSDNSF